MCTWMGVSLCGHSDECGNENAVYVCMCVWGGGGGAVVVCVKPGYTRMEAQGAADGRLWGFTLYGM